MYDKVESETTVHCKKLRDMPIEDCGEKLCSLIAISPRIRIDDPKKLESWLEYTPSFKLREGVVQRLLQAAELLPPGTHFLLKECLRPISVQTRFFETYKAKVQTHFPELDGSALEEKVSEYVAPPDLAAHPSGAAVDLTLCDDAGHELDMGTVWDADPIGSQGACFTAALNISEKARSNRDILRGALSASGFVNCRTEWWHWSFGDREWALATGNNRAIYSQVLSEDA